MLVNRSISKDSSIFLVLIEAHLYNKQQTLALGMCKGRFGHCLMPAGQVSWSLHVYSRTALWHTVLATKNSWFCWLLEETMLIGHYKGAPNIKNFYGPYSIRCRHRPPEVRSLKRNRGEFCAKVQCAIKQQKPWWWQKLMKLLSQTLFGATSGPVTG